MPVVLVVIDTALVVMVALVLFYVLGVIVSLCAASVSMWCVASV